MENIGRLNDKLDIKILILFILRHLPDQLESDKLFELLTRDSVISYFDYIECLTELEATGHVQRQGEGYRVTEKGERDGAAIESTLPYTLRSKAEAAAAAVAAAMRREAMIKTEHRRTKGGWVTELALGDGLGEMLHLRLLVADEDMARRLEERFRRDPEGIYMRIVTLLEESGS